MRVAVIALGVYPSVELAHGRSWLFLKSCARFGIQADLFGIGRPFVDWRTMKVDYQRDHLKTISNEYTHVLYTDAGDSIFCGPMQEIIDKYEAMGSPDMLTAALHWFPEPWKDVNPDGWYTGCFDGAEEYKYLSVGGYLARREVALDMFERMVKLSRPVSDDYWTWCDAWREGWFRPALDSQCQIFQVGEQHIVEQAVNPKRPYNSHTNSWPCILHCSGGSASPVDWKDQHMVPVARKYGVIE